MTNGGEDGAVLRRSLPGWRWSIPSGLVLLVAAVYARTGHFASLDFDDGEYVFANPNVLGGLTARGVTWAMTAFHSANWHPLTWISHMADVSLFGPEPGAHHLVNVLFHAVGAVALFLALRAATRAVWPSAAVAALFAVHPLNVESVAWISQRKGVLSTLLLFLAIGAYVSWTRRRGWPRFLLAAVFLGLGLLAKPMLVTAPLLFLLLDFWPLERVRAGERWTSLLLEKTPFFLLAAGASAATLLAQTRWSAVASVAKFPAGIRVANALVSAVAYLRDAVWPAGLACFYPHPATIDASVGALRTAGAAMLLAGLTAGAVAVRKTRPWLLFGWAWYLVGLLPVIGIIQVGSQARADRYAYVPMIGIFVAVVWEVAARVRERRVAPQLAAGGAAAALAALSIAAFVQVGTWRDAGTLYTHALEVTGHNWLASNNLGIFRLSQDEPARALATFEEAARMRPEYEQAWFNQGVALTRLSRNAEAVRVYRRNLELDPSNTDGWINLGLTYLDLGRLPEALQAYEKALTQRPQDPLALSGAAFARASLGDSASSLAYLARLEQVDPDRAAGLRRDLSIR